MKTFKEQQKLDEKDITAISSWKKKLKKVKGLTKQQMQMLATLPTPVLTQIINQVGMVVADTEKDKPELKEAPINIGSVGGLKILANKMVDRLSKEGKNRRIQLMTQIGKILNIKVKILPNGKIELDV